MLQRRTLKRRPLSKPGHVAPITVSQLPAANFSGSATAKSSVSQEQCRRLLFFLAFVVAALFFVSFIADSVSSIFGVVNPDAHTSRIHPTEISHEITVQRTVNSTFHSDMGASYYWYPLEQAVIDDLLATDTLTVIRGPHSDEQTEAIAGIGDRYALYHSVRLSLCYMYRAPHRERVKHMVGYRELPSNAQWKQDASNPNAYLRIRNAANNAADSSEMQLRPVASGKRNYLERPVQMGSDWKPQPQSELKCDIPCEKCRNECDITNIRWTMENVRIFEETRKKAIASTTRLDSQVPVPYFSYYEFGVLQAPIWPKIRESDEALSAAFISNCGFSKRNKFVRDLKKFDESGLRMADSYGHCEHNRDESRVKSRDHTKISTLATHYYFSLAFENSETEDYITEKYFGSLCSGAVPVYIGAPNVKFFAPDVGDWDHEDFSDVRSVVYTGNYDFSAEKVADLMKEYFRDEPKYKEALRWKRIGFSGDFQALNELTSTHTSCRQCILAADRLRLNERVFSPQLDAPKFRFGFGFDLTVNGEAATGRSVGARVFYVRERGNYRFVELTFGLSETKLTFVRFVTAVLRAMKRRRTEYNLWKNNEHPNYKRIGPALYAVYRVPHKTPVLNDNDLANLPDFAELEVIFT